PYQEEGGGEGVDDDVLQALLELEALPAQGEEDEGGEECHLIKDEEVEEVPGQERAVDARQLDVEERVEEGPLPRLIQGADGEPEGDGPDHACDQHQEHVEPVGDEEDTVGGRPVPRPVDQRPLPQDRGEEDQIGYEGGQHAGSPHGPLVAEAAVAQNQQDGEEKADHHRQDRQVAQRRQLEITHGV